MPRTGSLLTGGNQLVWPLTGDLPSMGSPFPPNWGRAGVETPSSLARQVIGARKPPHHGKVVPTRGDEKEES